MYNCELCEIPTHAWILQVLEAEAIGRPRSWPVVRYLCQRCHEAVKGWQKFTFKEWVKSMEWGLVYG